MCLNSTWARSFALSSMPVYYSRKYVYFCCFLDEMWSNECLNHLLESRFFKWALQKNCLNLWNRLINCAKTKYILFRAASTSVLEEIVELIHSLSQRQNALTWQDTFFFFGLCRCLNLYFLFSVCYGLRCWQSNCLERVLVFCSRVWSHSSRSFSEEPPLLAESALLGSL